MAVVAAPVDRVANVMHREVIGIVARGRSIAAIVENAVNVHRDPTVVIVPSVRAFSGTPNVVIVGVIVVHAVVEHAGHHVVVHAAVRRRRVVPSAIVRHANAPSPPASGRVVVTR